LQLHPWSGELTSVRISPEGDGGVDPVFSRRPLEDRPAPWL
jgi:hypothetical protein